MIELAFHSGRWLIGMYHFLQMADFRLPRARLHAGYGMLPGPETSAAKTKPAMRALPWEECVPGRSSDRKADLESADPGWAGERGRSTRRCAPAFLGPDAQLPPVAARRAADPVPLRRLPARSGGAICPTITARTRAATSSKHRSMSRPNGIRAIPSARCATSQALRERVRIADGRGGAGLARPCRRARACSSSRRRSTSCAASATSRAPTRRPATAAPGGMTDAAWRAGFARARAATACASTCRRRGGTCTRRRSWRADFPDTQIILNHTGLPADRSADGHRRLEARDGDARRVPERRGEDLRPRPAGPAVDGRRPTATSCCTTIELFGVERCMFASNFPGRQPVRDVRARSSPAFARSSRDFSGARAARAVPRQRDAHLRDGMMQH